MGEDVTRAAGKEHPVREVPAPLIIASSISRPTRSGETLAAPRSCDPLVC